MLIPDRITRYKIEQNLKNNKKVMNVTFYKTGNKKLDSMTFNKHSYFFFLFQYFLFLYW